MRILVDNPYLFQYFSLVVLLLVLFGISFYKGQVALRKWSGIGLIITPVVYFYLILEAYTLNIPYTDDFNLLETVHNFHVANGFVGKIEVLFEQVNQHRFAFERTVMLIMYFFTGTVNIKTQILLGNLALLGIFYLLFLTFKKEQISWYYFIPVPYVLFNLVYFENAVWGIAAIQNTPLIFFALLSSYGMGRNDQKGFYLGIAAALLTTFTSGSGILTWIIGTLILALQKRFKLLFVWLAIALAIVLFYFLFDYQVIPSHTGSVWPHPIFNLIFVFAFWGNAFYLDFIHPIANSFYADMIWCVLLGAGILLVFCIWLVRLFLARKTVWSDWFLWGAMMFAMGTGAMFVISRPISSYVMYGGNIFSRRYMIFGVALLATVYVCVIILAKNLRHVKRIAALLGLFCFIALNFVSYYLSVTSIRKFHEDLAIDSFYWKNHKTFLTTGDNFGDIPFWNHPTRMSNLIDTLNANNLLDFGQYKDLPEHKRIIAETGNKLVHYQGEFDLKISYVKDLNNVSSKFLRFEITHNGPSKPVYFVLASNDRTLLLPALPVPNSVSDLLKSHSYYGSDYQYSLYRSKLPAGLFEVWMMEKDPVAPGKWKSYFTGKSISLI
ncbi:hypothetical protein MUK70_28015 [Dyadobacter chenwenxiniae]|uniref:Uncharacterized protein n=1 Tax=Dyadobacter chenwenxiniae TaxID=2906456 RepID=A0A9X1PR29_9BACT|nr:hypothetical protein [Dyadobacter chenwenxiniae]MCF0064128.1 hypothetical protein [Dyadobacter chenwenxiniae]UON82854.1 hypothetical protein MUK70_28015 [Dyadobacter chenwenxiniae]